VRASLQKPFGLALHLLGWISLLAIVAGQHMSIGGRALLVGAGLTAYTLGVRHACETEYIAAIDNSRRSLRRNGKRPLTAGFCFSLGYSTAVFVLTAAVLISVRTVLGYPGLVGTVVCGVFSYLLASVNMVLLYSIVRTVVQTKSGTYHVSRLERRATGCVRSSWQAYPVGVLFGLGVAGTHVALLVLAGTAAAVGLPWYAVLCLPVLFAAGLNVFDTVGATFMNVQRDSARTTISAVS
jgi:nickel/cobalt transporter (NiCoT) family protein